MNEEEDDVIIRLDINGQGMFALEYLFMDNLDRITTYCPADSEEEARAWFDEHFRPGIDHLVHVRELTDDEWKEYWWNTYDHTGRRIRSWKQVRSYLAHYAGSNYKQRY